MACTLGLVGSRIVASLGLHAAAAARWCRALPWPGQRTPTRWVLRCYGLMGLCNSQLLLACWQDLPRASWPAGLSLHSFATTRQLVTTDLSQARSALSRPIVRLFHVGGPMRRHTESARGACRGALAPREDD